MKKILYLSASALGGIGIGTLCYVSYAYIQLITVSDYAIAGQIWYQAVGACIGFAVGTYWQRHYRYWSSLSFMPKKKGMR